MRYPDAFRIVVTQADIDKARREVSKPYAMRASNCPVAQALKRRYPYVMVGSADEIHVGIDASEKASDKASYRDGSAMSEFIEAFDSGMPVHPRSFRLEKM